MSKQTYLARYMQIIDRLERGPATFEQLRQHLQRASDSRHKNLVISRRTLQRDIKDIGATFNIEIGNERKGDRRYFIQSSEEENVQTDHRLIESYRLINVVQSAQAYTNYVLMETRQASGLQHFHGLLHAARNTLMVRFNYTKYWEGSTSIRLVNPLALKESQHRWYLMGIDDKDNKLKTFALDRMSDLDITRKKFSRPKHPDIASLFTNHFGVMIDENYHPQVVELAFTQPQGQYIKTFPLHTSQKVIKETSDEVVIELQLVPTFDFVQACLSFGADVEVKRPAALRKTIQRMLTEAAALYTS